jgi:hypothetical protein
MAVNRTTLDLDPYWSEKSLLASSFHALDLFAYLRFNVDLTAIADCLVFVSGITIDINNILTKNGVNADEVPRKTSRIRRRTYLMKDVS